MVNVVFMRENNIDSALGGIVFMEELTPHAPFLPQNVWRKQVPWKRLFCSSLLIWV